MLTCTGCGRDFQEYRTPDEKILQAVFGGNKFPKCHTEETSETCTTCGVRTVNPYWLNNQPYCMDHIPYDFD